MRYWILPCLLAIGACTTSAPQPATDQSALLLEYRARVESVRNEALARLNADHPDAFDLPTAEIIRADLAFAEDAARRGDAEAFAAVMEPEGLLMGGTGPIYLGPEGARKAYAGPPLEFSWAPVAAIANDGIGASWGVAAFRTLGARGAVTAHRTRYLTVWRRDASGDWRVWVDMGNAGPGLESLVK